MTKKLSPKKWLLMSWSMVLTSKSEIQLRLYGSYNLFTIKLSNFSMKLYFLMYPNIYNMQHMSNLSKRPALVLGAMVINSQPRIYLSLHPRN
jgi:hypothetical protein